MKGRKMPGQMGKEKKTVEKLQVCEYIYIYIYMYLPDDTSSTSSSDALFFLCVCVRAYVCI